MGDVTRLNQGGQTFDFAREARNRLIGLDVRAWPSTGCSVN
jgi:hypothetical protein